MIAATPRATPPSPTTVDDRPAAHRRTGGRSAIVLAAIRDAVQDLVRERGSERVTIPMVAERAGVNPTSIYRRWGDLPTMINDLATHRLDPERSLPDTGDLRADLIAWAQEIRTHYTDPSHAALLRGGIATAGERESDCLRHRRAEATVLLQRGGSTVPASLVGDIVMAPLIHRVLLSPWTLADLDIPRSVDRLLAES